MVAEAGTSLAGLQDLALPAPPAWWPPGPAWWLLGALLLAGLGWLGLQAWRRYRRNRYRRAALRALAVLAGAEASQLLPGLSELLKRTALAAFPRAQVASLSGRTWRDFLAASGGPGFAAPACACLFESAYRSGIKPDGAEAAALIAAARQWILAHPAPARLP